MTFLWPAPHPSLQCQEHQGLSLLHSCSDKMKTDHWLNGKKINILPLLSVCSVPYQWNGTTMQPPASYHWRLTITKYKIYTYAQFWSICTLTIGIFFILAINIVLLLLQLYLIIMKIIIYLFMCNKVLLSHIQNLLCCTHQRTSLHVCTPLLFLQSLGVWQWKHMDRVLAISAAVEQVTQ